MDNRVTHIDQREVDVILYDKDNLPLTISYEELWEACYTFFLKRMPFDKPLGENP